MTDICEALVQQRMVIRIVFLEVFLLGQLPLHRRDLRFSFSRVDCLWEDET